MDESSKKNIKVLIFSVLSIWGVFSTVFYIQFSQLRQDAESIDLLSSRMEEFRYALSFPDPIRAQHIEQMSLNLELVKSAAIQIESASPMGFWSPETAQLVYLTKRFVERAENYLNVAMNIRGLSEQILKAKSSEGTPEGLVSLYNELGAYMFSSFYADANLNPPNFMTLESIMLRSEQYDVAHKKQIQSLLSQSSIILAEHAQLSYVTEEIIKHSVVREIDAVRFGFKTSEKRILTLTLFLSGLLIFSLSWFAFIGRSKASDSKAPIDELNAPKEKETMSSTHVVVDERGRARRVQDLGSQKPSAHVSFVPPVESKSRSHEKDTVNFSNAALPSAFDPGMMLETFDQDEDSVLIVLNVFLQDHSDDANKLKEALKKEKNQAHRIVHSLKGVAGNLGASRLKSICTEIEMGLKEGSLPSEQSMLELEQCLKRTVDDVESYLGTVSTA
ncbi:Hpt domain-containing protein [Vibrio sp. S9_S30]|uniref:Hpt domain-containing protein n=1 Tax=Vibrio sp. S9_S30 TaxID=2720226 RepID=UPI0016800F7B|nr:Hpt domain-containing protein [Vibrio sp. S9_S30]MBD1559275.1 Hpt domain-containing protein [Vibrio sp. S9_S30]